MKKSKIKLNLNKKNISNLKTSDVIGGVSGTTCEITRKYYNTCYSGCVPGPTFWDCFTIGQGCPEPADSYRVCKF